MKRILSLAVAFAALVPLTARAADAARMSGWISDSMCGAKHTGSGSECVKKCIQNGMKPVFVDQSKKVWAIDNPDSVKNYYGDKVSVKATADTASKSVHIESVEASK